MNTVHDMGGMHNFGPIRPEADEPVFHADWERRVLAMNVAAGALGAWNIDIGRYARERIPAAEYLRSTYYEIWLAGLERLLVERGLVTPAELASGRASRSAPHPRRLDAAGMEAAIRRGSPARVESDVAPRYRIGERVRARRMSPIGHTRLPRYARGAIGTIALHHGVQIFADSHGMDAGKDPQHLYSVRFTARELWGPQAHASDTVHIDLWEPHLESVE